MIEVRGLTKRYGGRPAVDDLTFTVRPGVVTGFLGPNGAGKSTTIRLLLGLARPDSGSAWINGRPYREYAAPLREAGALLEARSANPARTAYRHLLAIAQASGIRRDRVEEIIDAVGLRAAARRRAGGYSLGMGQRLGIAAALLGDPRTVILDEPLNGLDTEGIRWVRSLLRGLAEQGATVFISSHLMSEMALTAQHLIVIGRGRLIADTPAAEFIAAAAPAAVRVRGTDPAALAAALSGPGVTITPAGGGALTVTGLSTDQVAVAAQAAGLTVLELTAQQASLEEAFVNLTRDAVQYRAAPPDLREHR
ncbi:MAG TPA: ATP-binding cassette domain-containing protein [Streptosporangiaceae bacterium]|jgi:ABC-2 type transport system ATP-binding protein